MCSASAQNVSDFSLYSTKYKDYDIISLTEKIEISVNIKNGKLDIEESIHEEQFYNSFKAGAYSESTVESSHFDSLKYIDACTLVPEKNEFEKIKVKEFKTKEVFDETNFYQDVFSTAFTYPSLRQGAITRLNYILAIKNPHFSPIIFVKKNWPVQNFELTINSDKNVDWGIYYLNIDSSSFQFKKEIKGSRVIYTWKSIDIEGFKKEPDAPNLQCILPQILPYIKSYTIKNKETAIYRNTDDLFAWYNSHLDSLDHRHTDEMVSVVTELTKKCTNEKQKVANIYSWVQHNIKYIANEYGLGGYIPRNAYQVFEKRYGDCKDMATIIIELLDIAGIKAYHTWIGTRDLPYKSKIYPTSACSNHMIASYMGADCMYFLDATNCYNQLGLSSSFIQGKEAFIRKNEKQYEIITVPEVVADTNYVIDSVNICIIDDKIIGNGQLNSNGYYCVNTKQVLSQFDDSNKKKVFFTDYLQKGSNKFALESFNISTSNTNIAIDYSFNVPDYVKLNNDEIYVNINFSQAYRNFELFKEDRKFPYQLRHTFIIKEVCVLNIPNNFDIKYLPEASQFITNNLSCSVSYKKLNNKIYYQLKVRGDKIQFEPNELADWNKMIKQLRLIYKDAVVLKKINK